MKAYFKFWLVATLTINLSKFIDSKKVSGVCKRKYYFKKNNTKIDVKKETNSQFFHKYKRILLILDFYLVCCWVIAIEKEEEDLINYYKQ